jgi:type I restriction enzyme, R subunit
LSCLSLNSSTKNPDFHPGSFVPPQNPAVETQALKQELEQLRAELQASRTAAELAQITAQQEAQRRISAEELAKEASAQKQAALNHLVIIQATAESQSAQTIQETIQLSQQAGENIDLDERETRRLIDAQLRAASWEVDSEQLTYSNGIRPQKGKNLAIAEWPTDDGRADYVLFVGIQVVAVVEAKRQSTSNSHFEKNQRKFCYLNRELVSKHHFFDR